MNCFAIQPDEALLVATAPDGIVKSVFDERSDTLIFGGFEDDRLVTYAVFEHPQGKSREVWLSYMYTAEQYREKGMATELLVSAEDYLSRKKITDLLVRILTKPETAQEYRHFFCERGFLALSLTGRCLVYQYSDMLEPRVFELLEKKRELLPPIQHYSQLSRKQLGSLPFEIGQEDEELSCFIMDRGEICGAAIACPLDELSFCVKEIWLDQTARKRGLFLPLLHAVCEEAKTGMTEEMKIWLYMKDEPSYHGLLQLFNPPEQEYLVHEYMMPLAE